ncbi:flagellar basal-body MS-ring/collar protein FliF [Parvularcula mediterranea]|uniref:flagellar basal-body MS-ring/collar protein FliF n=1 Tax=Parvularcula mediterranea TaxID=2732508 RepID=UPI001567B1DD|nr:flagellar basal-body MS-ring/collar protein FliF [Parvularcula mediterranea]
MRQKLVAGAGAAALSATLVLMLTMTGSRDEALLYAGLDPQAAGELIAALDAEGVVYSVDGSGIYVPAEDRDRLRLMLAQQNLPAPKAQGYELLDQLDGFSTTSQMFSATYWRAKEGEIARTLMTMPGVQAARVHIGTGDASTFSRRRSEKTASVTLSVPSGLGDRQVQAIRYLTALAVPGLAATEVAVIDTARGLLSADQADGSPASRKEAEAIEAALLNLLEARVGVGNARVTASVDINRRREELQERAFTPQGVVSESIRDERSSNEANADGAVTIASDLPDGETGDAESRQETRELREETKFAIGSTDRMVEILPGDVERVTVAVLVNDLQQEDGSFTPRDAEELAALDALVRAATGIDETRGDVVTVRSLPFSRPAFAEGASSTGAATDGSAPPLLWLGGGAALLALAAGAAFLTRRKKPDLSIEETAPDDVYLGDLQLAQGEGQFVPAGQEDPLALLRSRAGERPEAAAAILNSWLKPKDASA